MFEMKACAEEVRGFSSSQNNYAKKACARVKSLHEVRSVRGISWTHDSDL